MTSNLEEPERSEAEADAPDPPNAESVRTWLTAFGLALFLLATFPWSGRFVPEQNVACGPMWLFACRSFGDKALGLIVAAGLLPFVAAGCIRPTGRNLLSMALAIIGWVLFGVYLAATNAV